MRPWHEYAEGLRYMRSVPLIMGLLMVNIGWATGGGAAQILFTVFGELVFNRGPAGLGMIWGFAGVGLLCGGAVAYTIGPRLSFRELQAHHRRSATSCTAGRTSCSARCAASPGRWCSSRLSRAGVGVSSVLNMWQLLRIVPERLPRPRVFHHGIACSGR